MQSNSNSQLIANVVSCVDDSAEVIVKNPTIYRVSSRIPEDSYTEVIDVEGDGNCGFRALAVQMKSAFPITITTWTDANESFVVVLSRFWAVTYLSSLKKILTTHGFLLLSALRLPLILLVHP